MRTDEGISTLAWQMYAQIVVGIFLLPFGCWIGRDHARLALFGVRTEGKLVGYQEQRFASRAGSTLWDSAYMPVLEFQAEVIKIIDRALFPVSPSTIRNDSKRAPG